jgi:putative FmdB family regulatory protein
MPTYDYVCKSCGHRFEQYQSMTEAALVKCPECGRSALERLIGSGAGILFKGSGFYETDYKRAAAPKSDAPAAPAKSDKSDKSDKSGKSDKADKPAPGPSGPAAGDKPSSPSKGPSKSD